MRGMDGPVVARATLRVEYSDGSVREFDVPEPRRVVFKVDPPDLSPFDDFNACVPSLGSSSRHVEMSMDATPQPGRGGTMITVSVKPRVLDPDLIPFLDWPLYFPDDSVHCDKFPVCPNWDCCDPESGQVYIASARRMTIREFLADIKAHAEAVNQDP